MERQKKIEWGGYWGAEKRVRVKGPVGECKREREKKKESENSERERERVPPRRPGESYFEEEKELRRGRERGKACALASTLSAKTHHVVQEERLEERERDRARKK